MRYAKGSKGNGYKERLVPMLMGLDELMQWYLTNVRPLFTDEVSGPLFLSETKRRISRDVARNSLRRRQKDLGFTDEEILALISSGMSLQQDLQKWEWICLL
ncbi:MAG: hypothetical protein ACLUVD_08555 [Mediterraneibacter faecis]